MRYGIIGNCKTAALVHEDGSLDWCCLPSFDHPSVFARILDEGGGSFQVRLSGECAVTQSYVPRTNILETVFDDGVNAFALLDFMPRYRDGTQYQHPAEICRILKPLRGAPCVMVSFRPKMNYAQGETFVRDRGTVITASNGLEGMYLYSDLPLAEVLSESPFTLESDAYLLLTYHEKITPPSMTYANDVFEKTKAYWETWSSHCRLPSQYADHVLRSALVLKLMTYEDTGAIIAAPTTSLPEILHEERNWDYRYCWLRDASLMLEALKGIGHFEEARAFISFLLKLFESKQTTVQIVYGIDGRTDLSERVLPHLRGYKNSPPVRVGNAACHTQQNDIFGEMLDAIALYYLHYQLEPMPDDVWSLVKFLVNTTSRDWSAPDAGIWEFRHRKEHFTFSKVLSWVALDRGIKIAEKLGKEHAVQRWTPIAAEIRRDIESRGWNDKVGAYTQIYGSNDLDASVLLMHRCGFVAADDPRWISTVRKCQQSLLHNGFAFRYTSADDFGTPKNAFILASLWLAQALHSIGDEEAARAVFEKILSHVNHLGLLSEDIDVRTGELLGNFPQAYSHMAVINMAAALSRTTSEA